MQSKTGQSFEVRLLGQKIVLKSSEVDPDLVREVIDLVSRRIAGAEKRMKDAVPHHVALLALLDLAEEYCQARRRFTDHQKSVEEKARELESLIEAEFK